MAGWSRSAVEMRDHWGGDRMWRSLAFFPIGGLLGTGFGVALGFFPFPYRFPPPQAMEPLPNAEITAVVVRGEFIHAKPSDPIHHGKGRVTVYAGTVFLESNFAPGPGFHVYLVPKPAIRSPSDVDRSMFVDLGRLRSLHGQPEAPGPGRRQAMVLSERRDLVRRVRRAHRAGRPGILMLAGG